MPIVFKNLKNHKFIRILLILINDFFILNFCLYFSYFIRLEYFINIFEIKEIIIFSNILYFFIFFIFKINKSFFRFFNEQSAILYGKYILSYSIIFSIFVLLFYKNFLIPRSLVIIYPILIFFALVLNRYIISSLFKNIANLENKYSIIFGINTNINQNVLSQFNVKYYVIKNKKNVNRNINGVPIIHINDFLQKSYRINFTKILILDQSLFDKYKLKLRDKIISEEIQVQKISYNNNNLNLSPYFDFNYFFNRKSKILKISNIYEKKVILITGAGGSIGTGILSQLLKVKFKKIILIEKSEYNLFHLKSKFNLTSKKHIESYLLGFENSNQIMNIFKKNKIDIVFHAAAYKHVPLLEFNPFAAIQNNFLSTFNFIKLIQKFNVEYFCLISSDKAVRPTNIMGATKRLAELGAIYLSKNKINKTKINCVRFGNVINSSGSVLPLFNKQIKNNLPITLTDKRMIRYFMTIEEAANLVLSVYRISKGGEIFLLDMGEPIKLYDLVKLVTQFSGSKIYDGKTGNIKIKYIGLRRGEKLYEELLIDNLSKKTKLNNIFQSLEKNITNNEFNILYKKIIKSINSNDKKMLKNALKINSISYKDEFR